MAKVATHNYYAEFDDAPLPAHVVTLAEAQTLDGLFRARLKRTPDAEAYRFYSKHSKAWQAFSWREVATQVGRWQAALRAAKLDAGDRVAVMMDNCVFWPILDQAALGMGLVLVPLYANDRPDNLAYVLQDSGAKFLLIKEQEQADKLLRVADSLQHLLIKSVLPVTAKLPAASLEIECVNEWLPDDGALLDGTYSKHTPDSLASIVYTSGTTGNPKGVMLSHKNMLWNAWAGLQSLMVYPEDQHLSFLPLSHTLERTVGYYLMMMAGAKVAYNRAIPDLAEDLQIIKPSILIAVPRIFERIHGKVLANIDAGPAIKRFLFNKNIELGWQNFLIGQGRAKSALRQCFLPILNKLVAGKIQARLGGKVRIALAGGAAMPMPVSKMFIALGVPIYQGYGLTETSPILSVNTQENNDPASVGPLLRDVEMKNAVDTGELIVRSPGVMQGYWNNEAATKADIDDEGWLKTGDIAKFEAGRLYITGRVKEIIVLANGEKVPPTDIESAISADALIEQVMVVGEAKPYLGALLVLNAEEKARFVKKLALEDEAEINVVLSETLQASIRQSLESFPGYARIHQFQIIAEEWTIENELMTPTLKIRRNRILAKYAKQFEALYLGH